MKYRNVYVLLPHNGCSGGPELGHQLVDYLCKKNQNVFAVYVDNYGVIATNAKTPLLYNKYQIPISYSIEDTEDNLVVIPETMPDWVRYFVKARIAFWWMSVDNFLGKYLALKFTWSREKTFLENIRKNIHVIINHINPLRLFAHYDILSYFRLHKNRIIHFYQSEYAHQYILCHRLGNAFPLSDYINPEFFPTKNFHNEHTRDIILYNPLKGYEFTKNVIALLPEYEFIALQGFNREQLCDILDNAKLYIDFGNFPGKDRLPRECVLRDCCIVTGKLGASAYHEDVPIMDIYKFKTSSSNLQKIAMCVRDIMENYEERIKDFEKYKKIVQGEQQQFYREINKIFDIS